ncbi:valine--tRNA ligase [Sphingorhabdus sp. Alg239-R122]|uniref:valine--tRNA ligase n=1 Tax=Sphingorhabdus sp. Alg239-R122 TaxID=2305989 RepID=UPI0013DB3042|nr:valine--tRNA ligase [Sphingorhabdus sp. Alg239-R122]
MTLEKNFSPAAIETRWYSHWEEKGLFRPARDDAEPFTIVNPPPNVTGSLHIGHALDNTLQDIIIRHERMKGKDALWVVGTDHAGIATQMVVERQLNAKQQKRTDFTRDEFVSKVWEWKEESGGTITGQLRRLGCSMDWSNERFTMDEGFTRAVTKVFVDLYNKGLLYRDKRLVNWDPGLKTAISDLEVETVEKNGKFWHFKYPLGDGSGSISVATTRPETMLADMAVAVHPSDERYADMVGKMVKLPITGRLVPIVTDEHADPELGSGAVKITPGHDFNDFEVGKRAGFAPAEMLNMLDAEAKVCQTSDGLIPEDYLAMDRFDARKKVVAAIEAEGLLENIEDRVIQTPYGDRSNEVIEPWLTDQWYVDAETLAQPAIEAVKSGKIEIVPKSWEKTYFNWMENIQPWCVSRQLWWGHRIPAWFDTDGKVYVAEDETAAQALAGEGVTLTRDEDVLDTWFSSALWPFATIGWPEETTDLKRHYPGDLLISGFDILFFWDARMAMQGIEFMGDVPWHRLYLHGLVRADDGSKMSKSKGNVVDPLGLIDEYGADALRFFMAAMESQGRDIKMDKKRVEGYRNFATKLWNAARFCEANGIGASDTLKAPEASLPVNRWIISEVVETLETLDKALTDLRFDAAANTIYHFVWDRFCDWYLELIKPEMQGDNADETRKVAGWVLDQIIVMLHPFMPFITEELWHSMAADKGGRTYDLIVAKWPDPRANVDAEAKAEIDWIIKLVSGVRAAKVELNIPPGAKMTAHVRDGDTDLMARIERQKAALDRVGRLEHVTADKAPDGAAAQIVVDGATYVLPLEGVIDIAAEKARLNKAMEGVMKEAKSLEGRLSNANFVERAKPEAVEKARADHADKTAEAERLQAALARLG